MEAEQKQVWEYTLQEWESLSCSLVTQVPDMQEVIGAGAYNSNYHICAVIWALQEGKLTGDSPVFQSYDKWTRENVLRRHIK